MHDDHFVGLEAIHLAEDLIERLLAFVRTAADAGAAHAADGVDFVDEQQAGRVLLGRLEHVADATGADADEHLNEFRAADAVERHAGFAGDRTGQQRLARARRADQQHALGNLRAQSLKLLRAAQELDDLLQLALGVSHVGHVVERDAQSCCARSAWPGS